MPDLPVFCLTYLTISFIYILIPSLFFNDAFFPVFIIFAIVIPLLICETVKRVLFDGESIDTAMNDLLTRPFKDEGF